MLASAFKGVVPSDLYEKYHGVGGKHRMELDLEIASEISLQIKEASHKNASDSDGISSRTKGMIARRKQARVSAEKARISDDEAYKIATGQI